VLWRRNDDPTLPVTATDGPYRNNAFPDNTVGSSSNDYGLDAGPAATMVDRPNSRTRFADRPRRAPRVRRPPSPLGGIVVGLTAAVAGFLAALQANGTNIATREIWACAAVLLGIGLVIGARYGRARWLVLPAACCIGASVLAWSTEGYGLSWRSPDINRREGIVIWSTPDEADSTVSRSYEAGKVTLWIPTDANVVGRLRVGVGSIDTPSRRVNGLRNELTLNEPGSTISSPTVTVDITVGVGSIQVLRGDSGAYADGPSQPDPISAVTTPLLPGQTGRDGDGTRYFGSSGQVGLRADNTLFFSDGTQLFPDGSLTLGLGARRLASGTVILADATAIEPGSQVSFTTGEVVNLEQIFAATTPPVNAAATTTLYEQFVDPNTATTVPIPPVPPSLPVPRPPDSASSQSPATTETTP
jgi:hypothetical protein